MPLHPQDKADLTLRIPWREIKRPIPRFLLRVTGRTAERLLGLSSLRHLYKRLCSAPNPGGLPFPLRVLNAMQIRTDVTEADRERIPASEPLLIVANHPFGAIEGLALLELIREKRPDVRVMANYILNRIPELRQDMVFVDPFGLPSSAARNVRALRESLDWLNDGHALIIFPAGEVASFTPKAFRVRDPRWHPTVAALLRHSPENTHVLPVFVPGSASLLFHLLGKIHPRLRTLRLPREMLRLKRRAITLRIGSAIPRESLIRRFFSDEDALRYLRFRTFLLAGRTGPSAFSLRMQQLTLDTDERTDEAIIPAVSPEAVENELNALPSDSLLLFEGDYALYAARGEAIPTVLREIGRLREITFRAAGEGTGRPQDTDTFDAAYYQIILWHRKRREIIGCYRLALSDLLMETHGTEALYTRSLFKFDERFLGYLPGPAVELGRSFVRPDCQRAFAPLLLLWRGVLRFIANHPRYTVLFGPVSISNGYRTAARDMLVEYLHQSCYDKTLARYVSARLPPKRPHFAEWHHPDYADFLSSEDDVNAALAEIEEGKREMPVLIRQYLKLGGRIAAFNVDPDFGTVVDGLIVVDLLKAPPRDIARYMGKNIYARYMQAQTDN